MPRTRASGAWLVAAILAIGSSLAVVPWALNRFTLGPLILIGVAGVVSFAVVPRGSLPRWMPLLLLTGAAVLLTAALASGQPVAAILGRWPRYEGLVAVGGYALALVVGARLFGRPATGREERSTVLVVTVVAAVHALASILDALGLSLLPGTLDRSGALLGNASDQGVIGAAVAVLLARAALTSWTARAGVVSGLVLVLASGSRSGLLALVAGLLVLGLLELTVARRPRAAAVYAAGSGAAVALALVVPTIAPRLVGTSPSSLGTIAERALVWQESLAVALAHPVLGVGPSGFLDAIATVHDSRWFSSVAPGTTLDSPHSLVLQVLVAGGILALLVAAAFGALAIVTVVRRVRADRAGSGRVLSLFCAIGTLVIGLLLNPSSASVVLVLALLVGALVGVAPAAPRRGLRVTATAATALWLALVTSTLAGEIAVGVAVASTDAVGADRAFAVATSLRPWDIDTPVIAAETLTARLDGGDETAAAAAARWSAAALEAAPRSLSAARAAITTALATGDLATADSVTAAFRELAPLDPWIAHRSGVVALLEGRFDVAEGELHAAAGLDPIWAAPWETLAYLYQQEGRMDEAARATDEAVARQ
ncbi:hypothetical protein BH11ACT5_BH11ACT5_19100 [soil metagenome]